MTFLDPWKDPRHSGFQIIQSLISFGSGGALGVGIGDGMQKLFYLPEPHTDFILAVIAEESGVTLIFFLYIVLIIRGFQISLKAPDLFGNLLAAGLTMTIALEAFINIAGVMGLIPLKGLALQFFVNVRLVVSELRLQPILGIEENLAIRLPDPVPLHPFPALRVDDRGMNVQFHAQETSLDEELR